MCNEVYILRVVGLDLGKEVIDLIRENRLPFLCLCSHLLFLIASCLLSFSLSTLCLSYFSVPPKLLSSPFGFSTGLSFTGSLQRIRLVGLMLDVWGAALVRSFGGCDILLLSWDMKGSLDGLYHFGFRKFGLVRSGLVILFVCLGKSLLQLYLVIEGYSVGSLTDTLSNWSPLLVHPLVVGKREGR